MWNILNTILEGRESSHPLSLKWINISNKPFFPSHLSLECSTVQCGSSWLVGIADWQQHHKLPSPEFGLQPSEVWIYPAKPWHHWSYSRTELLILSPLERCQSTWQLWTMYLGSDPLWCWAPMERPNPSETWTSRLWWHKISISKEFICYKNIWGEVFIHNFGSHLTFVACCSMAYLSLCQLTPVTSLSNRHVIWGFC